MQRTTRTKLTAFFCLTLAAGGCAGDPDRAPEAQAVADTVNVVFHHGKWRQIPATPENQAEVIVFEQRVSFPSETALLDRSGRQAIDRLLAEADPQPGSLIRLSVAGSQQGTATFDRLTLQRLESVRSDLSSRGYESALADNSVARVAALAEHEVGLTVSRMMAVLPDCNQPQPLEPDPPLFERGFGCSNAYNLGVMVADPADLERGRTLDPADAERASLTVTRYRLDDPLLDIIEGEDTKSE
jgi:pilus assembly protein CpaD